MKKYPTFLLILFVILSCTKPTADRLYQCEKYPNIRYIKHEFKDNRYSHYQYMTFDMIYKDISRKLYPAGYDCNENNGSLYCENKEAKINRYLLIRSFESFYIQISTDEDDAVENLQNALSSVIQKII